MPELSHADLQRITIILNFFSFFLVAPEILGEERLARIEREFEKSLKSFVVVWPIIFMVVLVYVGTRPIFPTTLTQSNDGLFRRFFEILTIIVFGVVLYGGIALKFQISTPFSSRFVSLIVKISVVIFVTVFMSLLLFPGVRSGKLIFGLLVILLFSVPFIIDITLKLLADDSILRQRFLIIGTAFFVLSTVIEFFTI